MNELTNANNSGGLSLAENLAREAQFYSMQTQFNMLQLGRVLTEAKEVVEHGQWLDWIDKNAGCSERQAQIFMQLYETYGLSQEMAALGTSKLKILLPMTDEERDKLLFRNAGALNAAQLDSLISQVREYEPAKGEDD